MKSEELNFLRKMRDQNKLKFKFNNEEYDFDNIEELKTLIYIEALRIEATKQNQKKAEFRKDYYQKNKEFRSLYRYYWAHKPENIIKEKVRNAPRMAVRAKKDSYNEILKCTKSQFIEYIESLFKDGMSWDNYNDVWVFDHIIPVCQINNENIDIIGNFKNVQPISKLENLQKSDKVEGEWKFREREVAKFDIEFLRLEVQKIKEDLKRKKIDKKFEKKFEELEKSRDSKAQITKRNRLFKIAEMVINGRNSKFIKCNFNRFRAYIESQFDSNMSWDNLNKTWEIGSKLNLRQYDLTDKEQFNIACDWRNFAPVAKNEAKNEETTGEKLI